MEEKAILVGAFTSTPGSSDEDSMTELGELCRSAGAEPLGTVTQNRDKIDSATYVGSGKLQEIKEAAVAMDANLIIADDELSPSMLRNMEEVIGIRVIDRSALILDIFAQRALSSEGKIQVELAALKYRLPRLRGMGLTLSRQGGTSAGGIATRGPGETQLETDQRHIRNRIKALQEKLEQIKKHRSTLRQGRNRSALPVVSLVGYTNAGKTTLLTALSDANIQPCDMLFATLDTKVGKMYLPGGSQCLLVDTVGFIRKLPHHLIKAFSSTLDETRYADVILHVVDCSHHDMNHQIKVVDDLLNELECLDKPKIYVYNKCDKATGQVPITSDGAAHVTTAAIEGVGITQLKHEIERLLTDR